MKSKRIALFIAALTLTATLVMGTVAMTACGGTKTIVLNGSTSMEKVINNLMDAYMEDHKDV